MLHKNQDNRWVRLNLRKLQIKSFFSIKATSNISKWGGSFQLWFKSLDGWCDFKSLNISLTSSWLWKTWTWIIYKRVKLHLSNISFCFKICDKQSKFYFIFEFSMWDWPKSPACLELIKENFSGKQYWHGIFDLNFSAKVLQILTQWAKERLDEIPNPKS